MGDNDPAPPAGASASARALLERLRATIAFDRREMVALALLGVLVLTGATVAYARARPADASALQPVVDPSASAQPTRAGARIVVHVVGAVQRPGVYDFEEGARVVDAVRAAGWFTRKADRAGLNLARVLVDGEQLVVPRIGASPVAGSGVAASTGAADASGKLNLNTATAAQLEELPGIGPVLAQRIVDHRDQHGPFRAVGDLQKVSGIGPKIFASLEPLVTV